MDTSTLEKDLRLIVGEGVTTSKFERWCYTSDFVPIPKWAKTFFKTMPVAVVKPINTEQIAEVLRYCFENEIPVVPRGAGTSGLFGAVPKRGGVVLDLRELSGIIEIDKHSNTCIVQAGLTWWELDKRLREEGLTLKSYPSSALSATIGGWIMGSGLGIGSLKYGPVFDQILSAEVVLADGTVQTFTKEEFDTFFESEGVLGVVSGVAIAARKIPEAVSHCLISFEDMRHLFDFIHVLAGIVCCRPYAIEIYDHTYLDLVKASGHEVATQNREGGIVLVTFDGEEENVQKGMRTVETMAALYKGEIREGAEEEWNQRFHMLRVRRAVPTVIPIGVHVPISNLYEFYAGVSGTNKRTIGVLGHVVSRDDCMCMAMLVTDSHDFEEYALALHVPSKIFALARSIGGRPSGGVGVWNSPYCNEVLRADKAERITRKKKELDPKGILNPGMWSDVPLLFKPGVYGTAMEVASYLDKVFLKRDTRLNADDGFGMCAQCGYCMNYCPTRGDWISSTPRGKILITNEIRKNGCLDSARITPQYIKSIFACSLCGRCAIDCTVSIKSPQMWVDIRRELVQKGFELDCLKGMSKTLEDTRNTAAKPNDQRANWAKRVKILSDIEEKKSAEVIYFVGCVTSFYPMVQDIARAFAQILKIAGVDFALLGGEEWCCGYPLISAGHADAAAVFMRHNFEAVKKTGAKTIVVTCPGCYRMWKDEYRRITGEKPEVNVFHSTEYIMKLLEEGRVKLGELADTVTYHDPCDLGRVSGIFNPPRSIISSIPGVHFNELVNNKEYCTCCGSGGDLLISNKDLSLDIARRKVEEVLHLGVQSVVTACPSCVRALTMAKNAEKASLNVLDITQLVWKALVK